MTEIMWMMYDINHLIGISDVFKKLKIEKTYFIKCRHDRYVSGYNKSFNLELSKNLKKPVDYYLKYT